MRGATVLSVPWGLLVLMLVMATLTLVRMQETTTPILALSERHEMCNHAGYHLIEARFGREVHWLCLKLVDMGEFPLATEHSAILLDPDPVENENTLQAIPLDVTMAYGYPTDAPHAGSAEGYIGDDHQFYGVLHLGNRTLHADPYGTDDLSKSFGAFDEEVAPRLRRHHQHDAQVISRNLLQMDLENPFGIHFPYQIEERARIPGIARARVCSLLLLADGKFFQNDGNSSLNHVVRRMVHAVAQADIIFRNTDFNEDGVPDNIGFSIKYILVLTSNETNTRVFGDLLSTQLIDGRQYLMRFARLRRLSEVCLGVAFSGHAFHNKTLGLSFTSLGGGMGGAAGGLCDRRAYGRTFNTLALAHAISGEKDRVPERIAALTLAHEMGHSFGAHHDDVFPNPECRGFLMGSQSTTAETSRHFEFSVCSKRLIAATLNSMSYCLTEEDRPYCGNGIVEEGEACDCGMPSSCHHRDPCCTPRAGGALVYEEGALHVAGCSVAPTALCHPSQGLCCNASCKYANLTANGIDCTTLDQECSCVNKFDCRCALGGRCLPDGSCHAAECVSLGLKECQCHKKGTGGKVSEARRCGVCCQLQSKEAEKGEVGEKGLCVGAEFAAQVVLDNGYQLPLDWPDSEYNGPNVTLRFCQNDECFETAIRAWPAGDVCVSRGVVGLCSLTGVCKPRFLTPRSNVYPDIMVSPRKASDMRLVANTEQKANHTKSSTRHRSMVNLLVFLIIFVIK